MHFLKCNHCGTMNEVKSEYQVLCSSCNKKIDNNFREWKMRNPEKTFDDYKTLICISESDLIPAPPSKKSAPKSLKYWISFFIVFTLSIVIGNFYGDKLVELFKVGKTSESILNEKWIFQEYGQDGLFVETPFKISSRELPLNDNIKALIEYSSTHMTETSQGFTIMINSIRYKPLIGTANLQGAADGAIAELKMQAGFSNIVYNDTPVFISQIPGIVQKGNLMKDQVPYEFTNIIVVNGLVLYQISIFYKADDEVAKKAGERIIKSIKIDVNTKTI